MILRVSVSRKKRSQSLSLTEAIQLLDVSDAEVRINCRLREILDEKQITQAIFAALSGLSPATVGKICRNEFQQIDLIVLGKIMKTLQLTSSDDLLSIEVSQSRNTEPDAHPE